MPEMSARTIKLAALAMATLLVLAGLFLAAILHVQKTTPLQMEKYGSAHASPALSNR